MLNKLCVNSHAKFEQKQKKLPNEGNDLKTIKIKSFSSFFIQEYFLFALVRSFLFQLTRPRL